MSDSGTIERLVDEVPAGARSAIAAILSQIAHDLNTPVSTLTMETFSARILLEQLRSASVGTGRLVAPKTLTDLEEICSNLEHTATRLAEYLVALPRLVTAVVSDE